MLNAENQLTKDLYMIKYFNILIDFCFFAQKYRDLFNILNCGLNFYKITTFNANSFFDD